MFFKFSVNRLSYQNKDSGVLINPIFLSSFFFRRLLLFWGVWYSLSISECGSWCSKQGKKELLANANINIVISNYFVWHFESSKSRKPVIGNAGPLQLYSLAEHHFDYEINFCRQLLPSWGATSAQRIVHQCRQQQLVKQASAVTHCRRLTPFWTRLFS